MTPRPANSDHKSDDSAQSAAASGRTRLKLVRDTAKESSSGELSVFRAPAESALRAAARLDASSVEGTVGAAVATLDNESYSSAEADALLSAVPLAGTQQRQPTAIPGVRATDLVTELREISGQVNRMMSQVDRAIHRLGEHAGPPIRR